MENQTVQNPTPEPNITPTQVSEPKTKFSVMYLVLSLLIIALLASTTFFYYQNMQLKNVLDTYQNSASLTPAAYESPVPTTDPTANWQIYKDEKIGFEIKYPKDVLLNEEQKGSDKLALYIRIKDLGNYIDEPMGFDLKTATSDKKSLESGNYGSEVFGANYLDSRKVIKLDNLFAKTYISFQEIEVCNVQFTRGLIFYKNNYQVNLIFSAPFSYANKMPDYFTLDSVNCGSSPVWKSPEKFYLDITNNKAPQIALDWYNLFDQIVSTVQFTN